jgi:hypothetical protein
MKYLISLSILLAGIVCYCLFDRDLRPLAVVSTLIIIAIIISIGFLKKDQEYPKNIILIIGIGITIISWFVNGAINNDASILQSKRNLRIKFLLDAYFRLENADYRDTPPKGNKTFLYDYVYMKYAESALTSIQLLGDSPTIRLANQYILDAGRSHFRDLLLALRDDLRKELNLQELPDDNKDFIPTVYRAYRKIDAPDDLTPEQQYQLIIKLNEFDRDLIK